MAVSKRVRFEVLRRDNHQCRYCGGAAPGAELTIDHVVPVALGGSDDPSNLVAACRDCNSGKTSTSPDGPIVAEVNETAMRWSQAMQQAAAEREALYEQDKKVTSRFRKMWEQWKWTDYKGVSRTFDLPAGFDQSLRTFLAAGLTFADFETLISVAMGTKADKWKYFCGCCWNRIRQAQERAGEILAAEEPHDRVGIETHRVAEYDIPDMWLLALQGWIHSGRTDFPACACRLDDNGFCGDPACMLKLIVLSARAFAKDMLADEIGGS